jgi:uncharacterized protein YwbE
VSIGVLAAEDTSLADAAAACGGLSFTRGTKVLTASGALVAISKLKTGDKVQATDTKTGKTSAQTVAAVLVHHDTNLYDLRVHTTDGSAVIGTTRNHLFWDHSLNKWVPAAKLRKGEALKTPSGQRAVAWGGKVPANPDGQMWDLTIPSDHDFYVSAGSTAVLVHNCAEAGATGQIEYGSTDLSRAVQNERIMTRNVGGNYAAGRLADGTIIVGKSTAEFHAEESVIQQAGEQQIVDLYTEREPCAAKCYYLTQGMNVTWSWPWNPPEVRAATNAAVRAAARELFP